MTTKFPKLDELEGKLNERRKALHDIITEATADGGELDLLKVKSLDGDMGARVEAVRGINEEIDGIVDEAEPLRAIKRAALEADRFERRADSGDDVDVERKAISLGERYVKSAAHENRGSNNRAGQAVEMDVDVKTLMSTTAGWAPTPQDNGRFVDKVTVPLGLVDIIPQTTTGNTGAVTYWEETTYTNGAAETAEGATKPEGALATTERTAEIRKIAVLLPVTDEQLEDEPRVQQYIDNRLPFMVRQRLDGQIAVGDGSAPNLRGILNVAGIQTQAKGSDPTPDAVYKAMTKVMVTGAAVPDAYVTNPLDWQDVRLLRTTDGIYIWGSPSEPGPARIWGLNVVLSQAITENTGVVGDFANFSELAVRKQLEIAVGLNADDWAKNRQTFRAELRTALIWYRPTAFCSVTGI